MDQSDYRDKRYKESKSAVAKVEIPTKILIGIALVHLIAASGISDAQILQGFVCSDALVSDEGI